MWQIVSRISFQQIIFDIFVILLLSSLDNKKWEKNLNRKIKFLPSHRVMLQVKAINNGFFEPKMLSKHNWDCQKDELDRLRANSFKETVIKCLFYYNLIFIVLKLPKYFTSTFGENYWKRNSLKAFNNL